MAIERISIDNTQVQLTMVLKLQQLKREGLPSLSYTNLEDYILKSLWKKRTPYSLYEAADQILHVPGDEIVRFLSKRAVIDGAHSHLEDYSDVIGG